METKDIDNGQATQRTPTNVTHIYTALKIQTPYTLQSAICSL